MAQLLYFSGFVQRENAHQLLHSPLFRIVLVWAVLQSFLTLLCHSVPGLIGSYSPAGFHPNHHLLILQGSGMLPTVKDG